MKAPRAPRIEERRAPEFSAELEERARAWIPSWGLTDAEHDFGRALLKIAARFNSEIAERLDGAGEKMRRGFLDWLGERGEAARPSRMPVVFKLADTATEGVLASAPVRMQADAGGTPVVFETEKDVRVVPGRMDVVVGVDADEDAFYLPPPGLSDLNPLEPLPTQWQLKSFAAAGVTNFQLDPEGGLLPGIVIEADGQQYRIVKADQDLVTVEPPLTAGLPRGTRVTKVTTFSPFDNKTRNQQQHALYLGDSELLNLESAATIEVVGAADLREGFDWQYWGKLDGSDEEKWQSLELAKEQNKGDAVALNMPKGTIELHEVQGKNSRWIRAYRKTVPANDNAFTNDRVRLLINYNGCAEGPCPPPLANGPTLAQVEAEAMANTTPLPLNTQFFPLGKEPKQFDAFYLGSKQAFSKPGAKVQLCFEMAEASFKGLSALRVMPFPNRMLAGVGADGFLHLLLFDPLTGLSRFREPVRPPSPDPTGTTIEDPPISLDADPGFRPPIWVAATDTHIAVTARNSVWIWRQVAPPNQAKSGWIFAGSIGTPENTVDGLVFLAGSPNRLFALQDSKLFVRNLNVSNPTWELVKRNAGAEIPLARIAPIGVTGGDLGSGAFSEGLIAVDTAGELYGVTFTGSPLKGKYNSLLTGVALDFVPAAVRRNNTDKKLVVVAVADAAAGANRRLLGFLSKPGPGPNRFDEDELDEADLEASEILGRFPDVNVNNGQLTFVTCLRTSAESTSLAAWSPFVSNQKPAVVFRTKIPANVATPGGAPTLLEKHVVVPTTSSHLLVAPFDLINRVVKQVKLRSAVIASEPADQLQLNDEVFLPFLDNNATKYAAKIFTGSGVVHLGQTLYEFDVDSIDAPFFVFRANPTIFSGTVDPMGPDDEMKIDPTDPQTQLGSRLLVTTDNSTQLYTVDDFDPVSKIATLDRSLDFTNPAPITYLVTTMPGSELKPLLRLNPALGDTGDWNVALLEREGLAFPGAIPDVQFGTAFEVDSTTGSFDRPVLIALARHWTNHPPLVNIDQVEFVVDNSVGDWTVQLGETFSNPELSWEYWNGKGWPGLNVTDKTQDLKSTGSVIFEVPLDLVSSDWAGKTNFWIRARLIGGDYGREKITVKIKNVTGGTEQTVVRSSEGIRPPQVRKLNISYGFCDGINPAFVLAEDSGTVRDQSDANRTPGAIVEAFVPLALTLGRLARRLAVQPPDTEPAAECPPDCDCQTLHAAKPESAAAASATVAEARRVTGREVYIGLSATLSEAPVNVLLLVEENNHINYAPMAIEALIADRFVPIVADDATRALGESGVLSMTFPVPTTRAELFGRKDLTWLRLVPNRKDKDWKPSLRGAYLNAAWASATETLTRELLGSSNGAPSLVVRLARPPVLRDTLVLRVKEPLGEEEREALLKADKNSVLSAVEGLPGDWVLWKQVIDPDDEAATARVYALDEASGEIRFGDGRHGRIPPIGVDSIVAFSYARTEPDPTGGDSVPGNTITARTALNLISPVETVETVIAADQAAGGSPPESDDRVLRFGFARLRHRGRAVSAEDLEDLALQSSPDIVQARAFVRNGHTRLVVVMRGQDPVPTAAQVRELKKLLLDAGPASLTPGDLRIEGPGIRRLRIELQLLVETLDRAGEVSAFVKKKLADFFDTGTGGLDKDGWPLGANPTEEEIAFAINEAPYVEAIGRVNLREIDENGVELPSLAQPGSRGLVMLADDPIRIQFETAEVMA